jgi:hypothetical protein
MVQRKVNRPAKVFVVPDLINLQNFLPAFSAAYIIVVLKNCCPNFAALLIFCDDGFV